LLSVTSSIGLRKGNMRLGVFFIFWFVTSSVTAQSNADYLKSLQGEAESITLDKETELKTTRSKVSSTVAGPDEAPNSLISGLSVEQFEKVLQKNYIGSYLFYKRLSNSQKGEVYSFYQGNPDPDAVRDKILKVRKK
jgi:hypothetical protein